MATNFPTSLDSLTNPLSTDPLNNPSHADQHANVNDAVEALEAKVGVDGSAVTTSLDYKVAQTAPKDAQYVALATNGTLTNERVLTAGAGITVTDAGAGSTVTIAAGGYMLKEIVYFTSNGTFSKGSYSWLRAIRVKCQGAGGAGAGAATTTTSTQAAGGASGGSGAYSESFITDIAGLSSSVTVTVGAGGVGESGTADANANSGGSSSFGALVSANGGLGGYRGFGTVTSTFPKIIPGGVGGNTSGAAGNVTIGGGAAQFTIVPNADEVYAGAGSGSGAGLGGETPGLTTFQSGANGRSGSLYGGGGGGAIQAKSQSTARTGGSGAAGIVVVELYA